MVSTARKVLSVVGGVLFLLTPLATLGLGTPVAFGVAAGIMRSRLAGLVSLASVATWVAAVVITDSGREPAFVATMVANWLGGGTLAAFLTVPLVRALRGGRDRAPRRPPSADDIEAVMDEETRAEIANDPHVRLALTRRSRRRYAREILAKDPALATELGVGRPDLGLGFKDGGLVDVNGVPAEVLAGLPGFDPEMAERVVAARARHGPLSGGAELVVYADVPNQVVSDLSERLIYRTVTARR